MRRAKTIRLNSLLVLLFGLGMVLFLPGPGGEGKTILFPEMSGWELDGKPQIFSPETLFDYINGAADLYLSYAFQELSVAEYKGEKKARVTVEVYRHQDPNQAFGIYSQERLAGAEGVDLGAQGYREPGILIFISGSYYVKISGLNLADNDPGILLSLARRIEEILGRKDSPPDDPGCIPGQREKEKYGKIRL